MDPHCRTVLTVEPHPLLDAIVFVAEFPQQIGQLSVENKIAQFLRPEAPAPVEAGDEVRSSVRDLLRYGGFKPTGRNKPAAEYLVKAAADGTLRSINPAVDVCNAVSLHSGLPISLIDLDLAHPPLRIAIPTAAAQYVFNSSGQVIRLDGLVCLWDCEGPCANAVKDSQRTKTTSETRRTLTVIWGTYALPGRAAQAAAWYHQLLQTCGATISPTEIALP